MSCRTHGVLYMMEWPNRWRAGVPIVGDIGDVAGSMPGGGFRRLQLVAFCRGEVHAQPSQLQPAKHTQQETRRLRGSASEVLAASPACPDLRCRRFETFRQITGCQSIDMACHPTGASRLEQACVHRPPDVCSWQGSCSHPKSCWMSTATMWACMALCASDAGLHDAGCRPPVCCRQPPWPAGRCGTEPHALPRIVLGWQQPSPCSTGSARQRTLPARCVIADHASVRSSLKLRNLSRWHRRIGQQVPTSTRASGSDAASTTRRFAAQATVTSHQIVGHEVPALCSHDEQWRRVNAESSPAGRGILLPDDLLHHGEGHAGVQPAGVDQPPNAWMGTHVDASRLSTHRCHRFANELRGCEADCTRLSTWSGNTTVGNRRWGIRPRCSMPDSPRQWTYVLGLSASQPANHARRVGSASAAKTSSERVGILCHKAKYCRPGPAAQDRSARLALHG